MEVTIMKDSICKNNYQIEDPNHVGEVIVSWIITHACQENCGYCIKKHNAGIFLLKQFRCYKE